MGRRQLQHEVVYPNIGFRAKVPSRTRGKDADDPQESAEIMRGGKRAILKQLGVDPDAFFKSADETSR